MTTNNNQDDNSNFIGLKTLDIYIEECCQTEVYMKEGELMVTHYDSSGLKTAFRPMTCCSGDWR